MKILVLGAGVIGLTTALALVRRGDAMHRRHEVEIWAKESTPDTTSDVAAAFWLPYAAHPIEKVTRWAAESYTQFKGMKDISGTGIKERRLVQYFREKLERPEWASVVEQYHEGDVPLPPGFNEAFSFTTYVTDMTLYMPYLMRCCANEGIQIKRKTVTSLATIESPCDVVVNCTGLGARELLNDCELYGAKGQVVRVDPQRDKPDHIMLYIGDHSRFCMIVPRHNDVVLGGTYEETFTTTGVDQSEVERILSDCQSMYPALAGAEVIGSASGLRPVRSTVRLECERLDGEKFVIHNYGHGGAGVTLSWGCAYEVLDLINNRSV